MKVKDIWTDKDFESMNWHDNYIHSIVFPGEDHKMILDIDYIFQWDLISETNVYKFWISPCLLSFLNVFALKIDIDFKMSAGLDIVNIRRLNERLSPNRMTTIHDYIIETGIGLITFGSTGFVQDVQQQPILIDSQYLARGYVSK